MSKTEADVHIFAFLRAVWASQFAKGPVNTRVCGHFLKGMQKDFALEISFQYLGRPVFYFRNGDSYEFFVFEKPAIVARRGSGCNCSGLDIQLIND